MEHAEPPFDESPSLSVIQVGQRNRARGIERKVARRAERGRGSGRFDSGYRRLVDGVDVDRELGALDARTPDAVPVIGEVLHDVRRVGRRIGLGEILFAAFTQVSGHRVYETRVEGRRFRGVRLGWVLPPRDDGRDGNGIGLDGRCRRQAGRADEGAGDERRADHRKRTLHDIPP
jgi:hypothetical protein